MRTYRAINIVDIKKVTNLDSAKLYNVFVFDGPIAFEKLWYTLPVNGISVVEVVVVVALVIILWIRDVEKI